MSFTPGPLRITSAKNGDVAIVDGTSIVAECFADIRYQDEHARQEARANAILFAAAPDLYEALWRLMQQLPTLSGDEDEFGLYEAAKDRALAALARATGDDA